jgi:transcriptional regulator with XRE-family HTH domain
MNSPPQEEVPPNAIKFWRKRAGVKLYELAETIGVSNEEMRRIEKGERELSLKHLSPISQRLGVPVADLGFSYSPHPYPWATKPVPIVGAIGANMRVEFHDSPTERTGSLEPVTASTVALEILPSALEALAGYYAFYDDAIRERMSKEVLARQEEQKAKFIVHLTDGTTWWRRIKSAARRKLYHLEAGADTITDVEIEWVSEMIIHPGHFVPPPATPEEAQDDS